MNWFDTAELYGFGQIGTQPVSGTPNLGIKPGEVVIATKWWPLFRTASSMLNTASRSGWMTWRLTPSICIMCTNLSVFHPAEAEMVAMADLVRRRQDPFGRGE